MNIAIQNSELGQIGGINTYSQRVCDHLNELEGVNAFMFANRIRKSKKVDLINIQYEPGCVSPQVLNSFMQKYSQPIVVTVHHTGMIAQFYPMLDGLIFHAKNQIVGEPWGHTIIDHPALVFPEKGKEKMRKKYKLPKDKKIIGTMGFIAGTGKELPTMVKHILNKIKEDEFLYCITSFWKGGDFSASGEIDKIVKKLGKEKQFRIDLDFVDEEILNEKMQCCDLLFSWNNSTQPGGTTGAGADMFGARRKLIVKDAPHYINISNIDGVVTGRAKQEDFAEDVIKLLRSDELYKNIPDPEPYSWDTLIKKQLEYFREILGE